jgi:hypothetical protein
MSLSRQVRVHSGKTATCRVVVVEYKKRVGPKEDYPSIFFDGSAAELQKRSGFTKRVSCSGCENSLKY